MPDRLSKIISAVSAAAPESRYIRAYHASPYDFGRFDASKIGTGEGAQSFAHGLYFAQSPSVMEEYYKQFLRMRPNTTGKWSPRTIRDAEDAIAKAGSREQAVRSLEALLPSVEEDPSLLPQVRDAIAYIQGQTAPRARRYKVEIGYPESGLLDWDAPLLQQAPDVAARLEGLPSAPLMPGMRFGGNSTVVHDRGGWALQMDGGSRFPLTERDIERMSGIGGTGEQAYQRLANAAGGPAEASAELVRRGIPGVRYLDGASRVPGEGTRNYVMFPGTEDSIRILRKYGLLAPVAAGAAMEQE